MNNSFIQRQLSFPRVAVAAQYFGTSLQSFLSQLNSSPQSLYLCIFKQEQILEVCAKHTLLRTFRFTATTGQPGPKDREGDRQIPEGIYQITHFNPESKFHLSMRINYPNGEDRKRNIGVENLGGDIYIHGGQQSTGCVAIGDEAIAELYWLCVLTYAVNPVIPVHIFPCRMEGDQLDELYRTYPQHVPFWQSLLPFYRNFPTVKD
jgi:murein L,D-transpeptidase YafK